MVNQIQHLWYWPSSIEDNVTAHAGAYGLDETEAERAQWYVFIVVFICSYSNVLNASLTIFYKSSYQ